MKKITLFLTAIASTFAVSAQTFVSTSAMSKNAVLEEYTGIYCTYCPDGHKRANELASNNKGRVVLINIHTGGYAAPRNGDPDFRTTAGDAIAAHKDVKIAGYPTGSINRRVFSGPGTSSGRDKWATDAPVVMAESSPVNIDLRSSYDNVKNEVTVVVEAYFTSAVTTDYNLTVGITQSKIKGPQTGAAGNPDNIDASGLYNHNHVLRALLTPNFGEVIGNSFAIGYFYTKTFTWAVPADITGVDVNVTNLDAFAFLAEGQQNIVTGADGPVQVPAAIKTDLDVVSNISEPSGMCNGDLTPSFEVENKLSNDITEFKMSYTLNGGTPVVETFTGLLKQGDKTTIAFPKLTLAPGSAYTIEYQRPYDIAGGLIDVNGGSIPSGKYTVIKKDAFDDDFTENFEDVTDIKSLPSNWISYATGDLVGRSYVSSDLGGTKPFREEAYWVSTSFGKGDKAGLIVGGINKAGKDTLELSFATAYAQINGTEKDKFSVFVSKDCGDTWTEAWTKSGNDLKPFAQSSSAIQVPAIDGNWTEWSADLSSYGDNILVKLELLSDRGNSFWLDDISFRMAGETSGGGGPETGINTVDNISEGLSVFPNPTNGVAVLSFEGIDLTKATVTVVDITGKTVATQDVNNSTEVSLDFSEFDAGVYSVQVNTTSGVKTTRVSVY